MWAWRLAFRSISYPQTKAAVWAGAVLFCSAQLRFGPFLEKVIPSACHSPYVGLVYEILDRYGDLASSLEVRTESSFALYKYLDPRFLRIYPMQTCSGIQWSLETAKMLSTYYCTPTELWLNSTLSSPTYLHGQSRALSRPVTSSPSTVSGEDGPAQAQLPLLC